MRWVQTIVALWIAAGCAAPPRAAPNEPSAADARERTESAPLTEVTPVVMAGEPSDIPTPPASVESAARKAMTELQPKWPPGGELREGVHRCEEGGCGWYFEWGPATQPETRWGVIEVEDGTNQALFTTGPMQTLTIPDYLRLDAVGSEVMDAVEKSAERRAVCAQVKPNRAECITSLSAAGEASCPADAPVDHRCMWDVWVGSHSATETFRLRTFVVDPSRRKIVGISSALCGAYSLSYWRKHGPRIDAVGDPSGCPRESAR
jgi:hypothetical protein